MNTFADETAVKALLQDGADGFSEEVVGQVVTYLPQARIALIKLLETTFQSLFPYGYTGTFFNTRYSPYQYGSPHAINRRLAQDLYDKFVEDVEDENYATLSRAEAFLCLYEAIPLMGLRPTGKGGFTRTQGSVNQMTKLMSGGDLAWYRNNLYSQAKNLVEDVLYRMGYEPRVTYAL